MSTYNTNSDPIDLLEIYRYQDGLDEMEYIAHEYMQENTWKKYMFNQVKYLSSEDDDDINKNINNNTNNNPKKNKIVLENDNPIKKRKLLEK